MAIAGIKENVGLGRVEQSFHARFASGNEGGNAGVGQIGHGPLHGVHDFVRHMGRAG